MPEESLAELFDRLERQAADVFHAAADAAPALWDGQQWQRMWDSVDQMTREVYARVTQSGSLVPSMPVMHRDAIHPPPPPPPSSTSAWSRTPRLRTVLLGLGVGLTTGLVLEAVLPPHTFRRLFAQRWVRSSLPAVVLPRLPPPTRPRKTPDGSGRLEAVLVLGAEPDSAGAAIARDLARKGFVVLASVQRSSSIKGLEKDGRGWIKALVLDPSESSSFAPFLRSITASLSLRFPLHSPGDAFVSDGHALCLSGLVNALPLTSDPLEGMRPVEACDAEDVERAVRETAGTAVAVLKGVLPMMRTACNRPDAPDGVVLTLLPSATSSLSLPFHSVSSVAHQSLESLMRSFKRELAVVDPAAAPGRVRVTTLTVGGFASRLDDAPPQISVPHHLHVLYAPALARRLPPEGASRSKPDVASLARLSSRVYSTILDPRTKPWPRTPLGPHASTYRFTALLPGLVLDAWFSAVEGVSRWVSRHDGTADALAARIGIARPRGSPTTGSTGRRPLPTPPTASSSDPTPDGPSKRFASGPASSEESSEGDLAASFVGSEEDWSAQSSSEPAEASVS